MRANIRFAGAAASIVLAVSAAGCGSSGDRSDSAQATAGRGAALHHRIERLERSLARRRAALRVRRSRERRREARRAAAHTRSASSNAIEAAGGDFAKVEAEVDGEVGAAIGPPGSGAATVVGGLGSVSAWSTSKVPISLRVLQDDGGPSGLSSTQADEMRRALTLSDNEAAAALFGDLERAHGGLAGASAAVTNVLREAGDQTTEISTHGRDGFSTYGQTDWSLTSQELFMSRLAAHCIGSPASDEYVLGLMGEVSSDTWGLGSAGLPARWKGGWGPGIDGRYLARQMGLLFVGGKEAVVTLAAIPNDGSFESAEAMATRVARWLAKEAPRFAETPGGC
jgi:hypothetical protein